MRWSTIASLSMRRAHWERTDAQMIIDVHAHCTPTAFTAMQERISGPQPAREPYPVFSGGAPPPRSDAPAEIEARLKLMDEAGVQMQVLSQPAGPYFNDAEQAAEGARLINDSYA